MVSPTPLSRTARSFFNPSFKLILTKPPDAADFEGRDFAFASQAGDGEGVDPEDLGDFVGCQGLDLLHDVQGLWVSFNRL